MLRYIKELLPDGPTVRRLPIGIGRGLRMTIDFGQGQTRLYFGLYEVELNKHLRRLCRPGYRSYDVGGQFGYDALVISKLTANEVLSLECDPSFCNEIVVNAAANPGSNIQVRRAFVGDRTDRESDQVTLDDLSTQGFMPDFIKMDIEGGEVDALRGAEKVLAHRQPGLLVEVHAAQLEQECLSILAHHGYEVTIVDPRRWLPDRRPIEHNRWLIAEGGCR